MIKAKRELRSVLLSQEENIATVTLNRPEVLNAMSRGLMEDLRKAVDIIAKDETIRAVIINGAGRAFCAGGDLRDGAPMRNMHPLEYTEYINDVFFEPIKRIIWIEKPVIAAIKGFAVGGGFDLAMACDIRIAARGTKMGSVFIRMGILPELGGIYFLPRLAGVGMAKLLAFTGKLITAEEAQHIGLVEKLVPEEELDKAARDLAEKLAKGPTKAIAMTKMAINRSLNMDLESSTDYCWRLNSLLLQTEDFHEGLTAFLQKRAPIFRGK
jgi:2-(1,2-epoxy-1,2-dihydrophenyl)acetyl-CoA isomerase